MKKVGLLLQEWRESLDERPCLFIAVFSILANLILVANPGFYSHDEWQKQDFVASHGLWTYIRLFGAIKTGPSFGSPVRPLGFIQEGITAQCMRDAPMLPHLFDVILHTVIALVFFNVLTASGLRRSVCTLASILFCLSPLTMLATGWVAASFDQWYCLFALAAAGVAIRITQEGATFRRLLALLGLSTGAILSKETAIMVPAAMSGYVLGVCLLKGKKIPWLRITTIACVTALPVIIYLVIRLPALFETMGDAHAGSYKPGWQHILPNLTNYLEYPFLPQVNEIVSIIFVGRPIRYLALFIHLALISVIALRTGVKAALSYIFCYVIFLVPVLSVTSSGSHYLYASSFGMSVALAWLILRPAAIPASRLITTFVIVCLGVTVAHAFRLQSGIYKDGVCQKRFLTGLDAVMADRITTGRKLARIEWDAGTPAYIGRGAIFGRDQYKTLSIDAKPYSGASDSDAVFMEVDCSIRSR